MLIINRAIVMKRDPSIIYAVLLLSLLFFLLYGFSGIDEVLDKSTFGRVINFLVLLIFGIIPILGLIQAGLYEYSNAHKNEVLTILKKTFWHLWQWMQLKKTW